MKRFDAMMHAPVALVVVDGAGIVAALNLEAQALFGWTAEELVGLPIETLVPSSVRDAHRGLRSAFLADPRQRRMGAGKDLQAVRKDGSRIFVEVGLGGFQADEGEHVVAAVIDVTERHAATERERVLRDQLERRLEDLARSHQIVQASNAKLQQFAWATSHDLKSPLRTVGIFAQLLRQTYGDVLDETGLRHLDRIDEGTSRMTQLVDGMLDLAQATRRSRPFRPVALDDVMETVRESLEGSLIDSRATVDVKPLPTVTGDPQQLAQVLQNLVSNALKYVRPGVPPRVVVDAVPHGPTTTVRVTDDGPGVPEDQREAVFQVMRRLHSNAEVPGAGLGLSLCREVVERHGGRIWIEDDRGVGCRVCFTLSLAR